MEIKVRGILLCTIRIFLEYLDGYIIMENFLELCTSRKNMNHFDLFGRNEEIQKQHFQLMDLKEKGTVSWSDFALFYSCKLIAAKNKVNNMKIIREIFLLAVLQTFLSTKLSTKELVFAKNLFLKDPRIQVDQEGNVIATKDHFNRVMHDLTLMLKYVKIFRKKNHLV